jgi:replicative DNA helicase
MTAVESLGLPKNLDAERYVLGSILLNDERFSDVGSILVVDDFSLVKHQRIFARMAELHDRGERIDRVTLADELPSMGSLIWSTAFSTWSLSMRGYRTSRISTATFGS